MGSSNRVQIHDEDDAQMHGVDAAEQCHRREQRHEDHDIHNVHQTAYEQEKAIQINKKVKGVISSP